MRIEYIHILLIGPAHYNPTSDCKSVVSWIPESCTANFASKTKRLHEPPPIVTVRLILSLTGSNSPLQNIPPPGSYEVQESYSKTQGNIAMH